MFLQSPGFDCAETGNSKFFKRVSNEITKFCNPSTTPRNWPLSFSKAEILSNSSEPGIVKLVETTPSTRSRDDLMCCLAFAISVANVDVADDDTPF